MKLTYGNGLLQTQQGKLQNGNRCITVTKIETPMPINSTPKNWIKVVDEKNIDLILEFKNIEGARTLQDELNDLISIWSKEKGMIV